MYQANMIIYCEVDLDKCGEKELELLLALFKEATMVEGAVSKLSTPTIAKEESGKKGWPLHICTTLSNFKFQLGGKK
jgi:hypothetical protein